MHTQDTSTHTHACLRGCAGLRSPSAPPSSINWHAPCWGSRAASCVLLPRRRPPHQGHNTNTAIHGATLTASTRKRGGFGVGTGPPGRAPSRFARAEQDTKHGEAEFEITPMWACIKHSDLGCPRLGRPQRQDAAPGAHVKHALAGEQLGVVGDGCGRKKARRRRGEKKRHERYDTKRRGMGGSVKTRRPKRTRR